MKSTHATKYEMVYSKNRRDIIDSTSWMDRHDSDEFEAAAIKVIYRENGNISSKDVVIDESLWTDVETPDYYNIAIEKRKSL